MADNDTKPTGNRPVTYTPTTGDSIGVTNDPTRSAWAQRVMPIPQTPKPAPGKSA